ncbi:MAG: hypothetical protein V3T49_07470 [Dehalococcoidia bacterium]
MKLLVRSVITLAYIPIIADSTPQRERPPVPPIRLLSGQAVDDFSQ